VLVAVAGIVAVGVSEGVGGADDGEMERVGRAGKAGVGTEDAGAAIGRQAESIRQVEINIKKGIKAWVFNVLRIGNI
jgi:hypothetical protein